MGINHIKLCSIIVSLMEVFCDVKCKYIFNKIQFYCTYNIDTNTACMRVD